MDNQLTCSEAARAQHVPLAGTAPAAVGYLLVQFNGPWPARGLEGYPDDPQASAMIMQRCDEAQVRPLFVRRHGSAHQPHQDNFRWAIVWVGGDAIHWHPPATLGEIAAAAWPEPPTVPARTMDPVYLVCTHGRRDQCCATRGRPVAARFEQLHPEATWECSHVGGHRLAGNVVVLPTGECYGYVEPDDVAAIIAATQRGRVYPPLLRGSSTDDPQIQAAKAEVLRLTGGDDISAVHVDACDSVPGGGWRVHLSEGSSGLLWTLDVRRVPLPDGPASCGKSATSAHTYTCTVL